MKTQKTLLITSVIMSMISIAGILYLFGWKLLLCMFFFEWGRNAFKSYMKQKEDVRDNELGKKMMEILGK